MGLRLRLLLEHIYHCSPLASPPLPDIPVSVLLEYSSEHKGYQCFYLSTNFLLVSQHVVFDEPSFPFASFGTPLDDMDSLFSSNLAVPPIAPPYTSSVAGTLEIVAA
jgi:hypothetical protein